MFNKNDTTNPTSAPWTALGMQQYSVKYWTVRSALHGTIRPYGPRVFGFAIHFALMLYRPLCVCVCVCVCVCLSVQAGKKPSPRVNVQSLNPSHTVTGAGSRCSLHTEVEKRKQRGMASTSGGVDREKFEEAPASFKSLVWVCVCVSAYKTDPPTGPTPITRSVAQKLRYGPYRRLPVPYQRLADHWMMCSSGW